MKTKDRFTVDVRSEIGELEGVILHTPGLEIENMTPENAERALYSDILNLSVASKEHAQLNGVLKKLTKTFQVKDLLKDIISNEEIKTDLLHKICSNEDVFHIYDDLNNLNSTELSKVLIEGLVIKNNSLTNYLSKERYSLRPLHNFFFTRDASVSWNEKVLIGKMTSQVRDRESIIMNAIFNHSTIINAETINATNCKTCDSNTKIEGGDVLIASEDILLIGTGARTTPQGIDFVINHLKKQKETKHIIVQELPLSPESFIHLDMVFTFLDTDKCMVFEPVILQNNRLQTLHITVDNGKVSIKAVESIPEILKTLGIDLKPIKCGGNNDDWIQEREQWHSGANFFAVGPGKLIGYSRNVHTLEELNNNGFEIIKAKHVISGKVNVNNYSKYIITIEGSELSRGGGGARCMTMPVRRKPLNW